MDNTEAKFQIAKPLEPGSYNARSRHALFLIEQLIVIAIFAVCAAVCVNLFVHSFLTARDNSERNYAMTVASSSAEAFRAVGRNPQLLADLLQGEYTGGNVYVFYSSGWQKTDEANAAFTVTMRFSTGDFGVSLAHICVSVVDYSGRDNSEILSLTVATLRVGN